MKPTYKELIEINPLLALKTPEEVHSLLDTMEKYGYVWDPKTKGYVNPQTGFGFSVRGLDMYTPKIFIEDHLRLERERNEDPVAHRFRKMALTLERQFRILILALIADVILGWIVLTLRWWLASIGVIILWIVLNFFVTRSAWRTVQEHEAKKYTASPNSNKNVK